MSTRDARPSADVATGIAGEAAPLAPPDPSPHAPTSTSRMANRAAAR
jgi:hypothetical protein